MYVNKNVDSGDVSLTSLHPTRKELQTFAFGIVASGGTQQQTLTYIRISVYLIGMKRDRSVIPRDHFSSCMND